MRRLLFSIVLAIITILFGQVAAFAQTNVEVGGIMPKPNTGDLDAMTKIRLVRILVPYSKTIYFIDRGRQFGTAVEFGTALEAELDKGRKKAIEHIRVAFIPTGRDRLIPALRRAATTSIFCRSTSN